MSDLSKLREQIDACDDEIIAILKRRMDAVEKIGEIKRNEGGAVYRPERERQIIERLSKHCDGSKLSRAGIEAIFYEIFSLSRSLEGREKVAFLGPFGTYSHEASVSRFGQNAIYEPITSIDGVFRQVERGAAKFGVVPIENNTEGAVAASYDSLGEHESIKVVGEIYLDINHALCGVCADISCLKRIYTHPQAYAQCKKFLAEHGLEEVEFVATNSTAKAAWLAKDDEKGAAICSKIAAKLSNIPVIFERIQDNLGNSTRFFVLSNAFCNKSGNDKTSIIASTDHKPGALFNLLSIFAGLKINITKLESRPDKKHSFKSLFYIDIEGHKDDEIIAKALKSARQSGHEIRVLGSYAVAK